MILLGTNLALLAKRLDAQNAGGFGMAMMMAWKNGKPWVAG